MNQIDKLKLEIARNNTQMKKSIVSTQSSVEVIK